MEVFKAAKLIDWTGYNAETAAVDTRITQTSISKLQQRVIQENQSRVSGGFWKATVWLWESCRAA